MAHTTRLSEDLLETLKNDFKGDLFIDEATRIMYATDASAYREMPMGVARPKDTADIQAIIAFAKQHQLPLIPRTAGTSLAGQVVGHGLVVDVSRYMTQILELNTSERWVRVQPGVILDELNQFLAPHGLFFGPETSTSSRCMMGGMVGNNSCGAHSLVYGSTRDHTLELTTLLSDGSTVKFSDLSPTEFEQKCGLNNLEGKIYRHLNNILNDVELQQIIEKEYPDPSLERRNTGYALDLLLQCAPFKTNGPALNLCKLLAGSEGTLAFTTEIKLHLVPIPHPHKALVCVHLNSIKEALHANLIALEHQPVSIELMDKAIMDLTKKNITQRQNRFFVEGDPGAILIIELTEPEEALVNKKAAAIEKAMRNAGYGYAFPLVTGADIKKVWALRKAGLGVLSNMPGDAKPVPVVEDTAVKPELLPAFIEEFNHILKKEEQECVYYAHIATGELHLRPVMNLKDPLHVARFHSLALETAKLVKKYKGSLSGEHGDGRLRGEFIPLMLGETVYSTLKTLKNTWDPDGIFNPGKIVDTPKMNTSLRYEPGQATRSFNTVFDFSSSQGLLRATEKCNGSGDCRKTEAIGGTMCPSYMATRDENATTRARANILRERLTHPTHKNPFNDKEIYKVMDLCLSCKGCKSECPSNVDMAKLKAEFLQHWYDSHHIPLRTLAIAYITSINRLGALWPALTNFFMTQAQVSALTKKLLGFAPKRSIPTLYKITLHRWAKNHLQKHNPTNKIKGKVFLFADEFTDYNDTAIGIKTIQLLTALGYQVELPKHTISGRTFLSKGLLRKAKKIATKNVSLLKDSITPQTPLVGIEPSSILTFRDEYPELVDSSYRTDARKLADSALAIDEFIAREIDKGNIQAHQFTQNSRKIKLHGHCQQKAVASTGPMKKMLSLPQNYVVEEIPSGCCGMAGSFGYEKEHYDLSMKIGELVLFPAVRAAHQEYTIAAPGTSCRHQIKDGTGISAYHPVEILWEALIK